MVRKKSKPVRNLRNNTLQILTERVESLERERAREEEEMNTTICMGVPRSGDLGQRRGGRHVCEVCDKDFASARNLARHNLIHTGEKPFKCRVCDKAFSDKSNLTVHLRTHTGEKPYQCHVCAKAFAQFGDLVTHVRVHTGIEPFKCDCGKAYKAHSGLAYHKRTLKH